MNRDASVAAFGERPKWKPETPRVRPDRLLLAWAVAAASVWVGAAIVPGVSVSWPGGAILAAAAIGVLNAILPPLIAALRLPYMLVAGFLLVLCADALVLLAAQELFPA